MRKVYENCAVIATPLYSLCLRVIFNVSPSRCVGMVLLAQHHLLLNSLAVVPYSIGQLFDAGETTLLNSQAVVPYPMCHVQLSLCLRLFVSCTSIYLCRLCSMLSGTLFHVIRNIVPCHPERRSISSGTRRELLKLNSVVQLSDCQYHQKEHERIVIGLTRINSVDWQVLMA